MYEEATFILIFGNVKSEDALTFAGPFSPHLSHFGGRGEGDGGGLAFFFLLVFPTFPARTLFFTRGPITVIDMTSSMRYSTFILGRAYLGRPKSR